MTITGNNRYLIERKLAEIKDRFETANGSMAIEQLDVADMTADQIISNLSSQSLFNNSRLVILKGASQNADLANAFDQTFDQTNDAVEVVIVAPDLDRRTTLYARLKDKTELQTCNDLDSNSLAGWLEKEAVAQGSAISRTTAKYLVDRVGPNQMKLSNELAKLSLYTRTIDRQAVDLLVEASSLSTSFDLLDATFARDRRRVNRIYAEQRAMGVVPQILMGLVIWQLHLLACLKTAPNSSPEQVSQDTGISVYAVKKSRSITDRLSLVQLKQAIDRLARIDRLIKQAYINVDDALLYYLVSF